MMFGRWDFIRRCHDGWLIQLDVDSKIYKVLNFFSNWTSIKCSIFDFKSKVFCEMHESSRVFFNSKALHFLLFSCVCFECELLFEVCCAFNCQTIPNFLFQTFMAPLKPLANFKYKVFFGSLLPTFLANLFLLILLPLNLIMFVLLLLMLIQMIFQQIIFLLLMLLHKVM